MAALKTAIPSVVEQLSASGCVGMIVVLPSDNSLSYSQTDGDAVWIQRRYVVHRYPSSFDDCSAIFCEDNLVMKSASVFDSRMFDPVSVGMGELARHGVKMLMATSMPLVGLGLSCTSYFLFRNFPQGQEAKQVTSDVESLSYQRIWSALRTSLQSDNAGLSRQEISILRLSQAGFSALEIGEKTGMSSRVVEKKQTQSRRKLGANSTVDAVVKAQLNLII